MKLSFKKLATFATGKHCSALNMWQKVWPRGRRCGLEAEGVAWRQEAWPTGRQLGHEVFFFYKSKLGIGKIAQQIKALAANPNALQFRFCS